jgi:hypothetical protein
MVYYDNIKWKHVLKEVYPHLFEILQKLEHTPYDYKTVYYHYKDNINDAKTLLDSTIGIKILATVILNKLDDIIKRLWLYMTYPYIYDRIMGLSNGKRIEYSPNEKSYWTVLLYSFSWIDSNSEVLPYLKEIISYIRNGIEPSESSIKKFFSSRGRLCLLDYILLTTGKFSIYGKFRQYVRDYHFTHMMNYCKPIIKIVD